MKKVEAFIRHEAFEPIRTEINVKLGQGQYAPAVKSDVAAVQDVVHAREEFRDIRIEMAVRVRDDADFHRWSVVSDPL